MSAFDAYLDNYGNPGIDSEWADHEQHQDRGIEHSPYCGVCEDEPLSYEVLERCEVTREEDGKFYQCSLVAGHGGWHSFTVTSQ